MSPQRRRVVYSKVTGGTSSKYERQKRQVFPTMNPHQSWQDRGRRARARRTKSRHPSRKGLKGDPETLSILVHS
ncbi:hypothetical protein M408DRAFT_100516 [Serendipita vermifera MAFF 305830]|uniref:Uncharacterized protein n=1 Tax=Serendipita vermifera MAFF 305830 TaxID=933852 RepID=A0A0C2XM53_SERVB|nr:hypothetical protein M408DRAFT_100516 [Serendipita vermifera MAFF 305830]